MPFHFFPSTLSSVESKQQEDQMNCIICTVSMSYPYTYKGLTGNIKTWWLFSFLFIFIVQVQFSAFSLHPCPKLQPSLPPSHFHPLPHYCPCVLYNCSWKHFTLFPWNSLPSPLWSLSACSQFQCLWLYFACLFVLLTRFLLKVRLYGIFLSPTAYFA